MIILDELDVMTESGNSGLSNEPAGSSRQSDIALAPPWRQEGVVRRLAVRHPSSWLPFWAMGGRSHWLGSL